ALTAGHPREMLEQAALALLDYIEEETSGFRVLVREAPVMSGSGNFSSVLNDVAHRVEHILGAEFKARGYDPKLAELYSQALVGAGGPQAAQGHRRRPPRQPGLERAVTPGTRADVAHPPRPLTPAPAHRRRSPAAVGPAPAGAGRRFHLRGRPPLPGRRLRA